MEDGDAIPLGETEIRTICTPGHTPGHMMLYLPKRQLLFSGDHILFDITPNIGVWGDLDHSLADYISSLEKTRTLQVKRCFPAHRETEGDVYRRIDALVDHHGWRLNEIFEAVNAHPSATAYEIAGCIT